MSEVKQLEEDLQKMKLNPNEPVKGQVQQQQEEAQAQGGGHEPMEVSGVVPKGGIGGKMRRRDRGARYGSGRIHGPPRVLQGRVHHPYRIS